MTRIAVADLETTGTDPLRHHLWEVAVIIRSGGHDKEYCWQIRPDLSTADPMALRIGRYYERCGVATPGLGDARVLTIPDGGAGKVTVEEVADVLAVILDGAVLAAANVAFDAAFLAKFLRANGQCPTWDYHLLEVESYTAGALGLEPPWKLDRLASELGVTLQDDADRHTALGDARLVRDVYDAARLHAN